MSKYFSSGKFNVRVKKLDSHEVEREAQRSKQSENMDLDETRSKLKPSGARIIGTNKRFVIEKATIKPEPPNKSINGNSSHHDASIPELKSVKPLNAQNKPMTSATTDRTTGHLRRYLETDFAKRPNYTPRSVLKSTREVNSLDSREKKKCVTIKDDKPKIWNDRHSNIGSSDAIHEQSTVRPTRIRRLSEGSNIDSNARPDFSTKAECKSEEKNQNDETDNCQYSASRESVDLSKAAGSKTLDVSNANSIGSNPTSDDTRIQSKTAAPGNTDLPEPDKVVASSTPSIMINGAKDNTVRDVDSSSSIDPSVKDSAQSQTVTEIVVETTASATEVSKKDEVDDEDLHTKSPDGRYIRQNEEIGRGSFKTVFKGLDVETGVAIAWCELMVSLYHCKLCNSVVD